MRWPALTTTLHFRVSALFLLLLALSAGIYYFWARATIIVSETTAESDRWYDELAWTELDSLAQLIAPEFEHLEYVEERLVVFGQRVSRYEAEVLVTDHAGRVLSSSRPDSLTGTVGEIDPALLNSMATTDWDWSTNPVPENLDAYANRIFEVFQLGVDPHQAGEVDGYLVASFEPVTVGMSDVAQARRRLTLHAVAVILGGAALSGLFIMAWLSRRIRLLSDGVKAFAAGKLTQRVPATSADEIGALGRHFNTMAARLADLIEELRRKEQFQRQLIANITHDLRTPMASVRGYVETLVMRRDQLTTDERDRYLGIIASNLDHLDKLVDHLLQISRLDSGQAEFKFEEFPLQELADEVLYRCEVAAQAREVTLSSEADRDLPMVIADPLQIAQVLQNLVENGIKFNRPQGKVVVSLRNRPGGIEVGVRDTGRGIPVEDRPHVFERFFTGDKSRSRKGESSGLGLAISHKILVGHKTTLELSSEAGKGTEFRFVLPAAASAPTTLRAEA